MQETEYRKFWQKLGKTWP